MKIIHLCMKTSKRGNEESRFNVRLFRSENRPFHQVCFGRIVSKIIHKQVYTGMAANSGQTEQPIRAIQAG